MGAIPQASPQTVSQAPLLSALPAPAMADSGAPRVAATPPLASDSPEQLVRIYVDALTRSDWEDALTCWSPVELARAARLDIRYRHVPLKIDSASPLILRQAELARGRIGVTIRRATISGSHGEVVVVAGSPSDSIAFTYHLQRADQRWRLVSPTSALARSWPVRETTFLRLREQPPRCLPAPAIARLESLIVHVCSALGTPPSRLAMLRRQKIDYFYAEPEMVNALAGAPTAGVALLQDDAVVTSEPCHLHELVHLLLSFCAGEVGLYVSPLLQEGAAVHFGGRWGRAPGSLLEMGRYALRSDLIGLDDLLTWDGFRANSADLTYAPAGLIAGYLLQQIGGQAFLDLYRESSGTLAQERAVTATQMQSRLAGVLGISFADVSGDLASRLEESAAGDLEPDWSRGSDPGSALGDTIALLDSADLHATIISQGPWLACEITSAAGEADGALLLEGRPGAPDTCRAGASRLFAQQWPGQPYQGEAAALTFDPREAGFYDFRCDLLLAKHVQEFRPSAGYVSDDGRKIRLRIRRALLPADSAGKTWRLERRVRS